MITLYAEDPGARAFIAPVATALGQDCRLYNSQNAPRMVASFLSSKPSIIGAGTSEARDSVGLRLLYEARRKGIATFSWIEGLSFVGKRFMGQTDNPLWCAPDLIFVASEVIALELKHLGYEGEIVVSGHPYYDICRKTSSLPSEEIVFLSERSDGISGNLRFDDDYTLSGRGTSGKRTHIVIEEFLDATEDMGISRRLQYHPKDTVHDYASYWGEFDGTPSWQDMATPLMCRPSLAVGITTNALTEFALRGSPVLSILPRESEYVWNDAIAVGAIPSVTRRKDIRPAVENLLFGEPDTASLDTLYPSGAVDKIIQRLDECLLTAS